MRSEQFSWIGLPLIIICGLSLGAFIATSWWSVDLKSAEVFSKAMKYEVFKYWSQYYSVLGNTELVVVMFLLIMILVETFFKYKSEKHPNSKWRRQKEGWLWTIYGIFIAIWLFYNIWECVGFNTLDKGFGPGFDNEIMDSTKYKQYGKIVAIVIQTAILGFGIWWVHCKMTRKQDFWFQEYWVDAIKALFFFALTYLIIAVLKWMFGRVYYYNVDFGNLYQELGQRTGEYRPGHLYSDAYNWYANQDARKWGFYDPTSNHWDANGTGEYPWWKLNGFFVRPEDSPQFALPVNYAFPSGHVNATYCVLAVFFLLLGRKRHRTFGKLMKTFTIICLLHLLSMNFAVVVMRWHWFSDTSFTNILAIFSYFFVAWCVDRLKWLVMKKHNLKDIAIYGDKELNR
ncbi:phosphatase PAP2 family protein [Mesoplasma lactucae]|nr:phosphatase PAP2 family protein [Mesoplasma lactucae]